MKMVNGKIVPEYHPQMIVNTRAFLDRVQTQGVSEAKELARCAELLEAVIEGNYHVVGIPNGEPLQASRPEGSGDSARDKTTNK